MAQYSTSGYQGHRLAWARTWVPHCATVGINPYDYNVVEACNCLENVHTKSAAAATAKGKKEQHSVFKAARAAIGAIWGLLHHKVLADEAPIKAMAIGLRRTAPNLARYSDTWDISLVFECLVYMDSNGVGYDTMPHGKMRPWVELLLKLHTHGRSGDLAPNKDGNGGLYRNFLTDHNERRMKKRCGFYGNELEGEILRVRWWHNKTIASRPSHYSKWHDLGAYLQNTPEFPRLSAICVRKWLETYVEKTDSLPRVSDLTFLSVTKHQGKHKGISAQRVSNDVGAAMTECGIPARYLPHSTRHASLSKKLANGAAVDNITADADVSAKVFKLFYAQPVTRERMDALTCAKYVGSRAKRINTRTPAAPAVPELEFDDGLSLEDAAPPPSPGHGRLAVTDDHDDVLDDGDGDVAYEVDAVLEEAVDIEDGVLTTWYKVRWAAGDITFETRANLMDGATEALLEFETSKMATAPLPAAAAAAPIKKRRSLKKGVRRGAASKPPLQVPKPKPKKKKKQATPRCAPALPTPSASATTSDFETALVDEDVFCGAGHKNTISAAFCTEQGCELPVFHTGGRLKKASSPRQERALARRAPRRDPPRAPANPRAPKKRSKGKINSFRVTRSGKPGPKPTETRQLSMADSLARAGRLRTPVARERRRAPQRDRHAKEAAEDRSSG